MSRILCTYSLTIFLIILLVLSLSVACDNGDETSDEKGDIHTEDEDQKNIEKIVVTIGNVTDLTGPAANALSTTDAALEDLVDYYNEQNFIPGVKLEVLRYDTITNPSRYIPAYEWLMENGVDLLYTGLESAADVLQARAAEDEIMLFAMAAGEHLLDSSGWIFNVSQNMIHDTWLLMSWIAENDWDYRSNGPAKIGFAGWQSADMLDFGEAIEAFANAHPEQFEYQGSYLTTVGNMLWAAEAEALSDCDYVIPPRVGGAAVPFIREYRGSGYKAKFIGSNQHAAWLRIFSDARLWGELEGMIITMPTPYWDQEVDTVELAKEILIEESGPDGVQDRMKEGVSYIGAFHSAYGLLKVVADAIERSGPQNFSSQALYNAAIQTSFSIAGNEWTWSKTDRTSWDYVMIYRFDAETETLMMVDPTWHLLPTTP